MPGAVIVTFRGTEPDRLGDAFDDARFALLPWTHGSVHAGFRNALERVWTPLVEKLTPLASRAVWFSGHSLGAALATLAADRFPTTSGVCTFGSPRVGDRAFAAAFDVRFGARAARYVNDADIVTHAPTTFPLPYAHVGQLRQITPDGRITSQAPALAHFVRDVFGGVGPVQDIVEALQSDRCGARRTSCSTTCRAATPSISGTITTRTDRVSRRRLDMTTRLTGMLLAATCAVALATPAFAQPAPAQEDIQKLFDAGKYQEVVEKTPADAPPDAQYRKGLARRRINQHGEAKEDFGRLSGRGEAWSAVGDSARALIDGNLDGALEAARKGVQHGGELAQAHSSSGSCTTRGASTPRRPPPCQGGRAPAADGLRALHGRHELLQGQARRQDGRLLRELPEARPRGAGAAGRPVDMKTIRGR